MTINNNILPLTMLFLMVLSENLLFGQPTHEDIDNTNVAVSKLYGYYVGAWESEPDSFQLEIKPHNINGQLMVGGSYCHAATLGDCSSNLILGPQPTYSESIGIVLNLGIALKVPNYKVVYRNHLELLPSGDSYRIKPNLVVLDGYPAGTVNLNLVERDQLLWEVLSCEKLVLLDEFGKIHSFNLPQKMTLIRVMK